MGTTTSQPPVARVSPRPQIPRPGSPELNAIYPDYASRSALLRGWYDESGLKSMLFDPESARFLIAQRSGLEKAKVDRWFAGDSAFTPVEAQTFFRFITTPEIRSQVA